jgi:Flp pilus assembly pilin Flp
MIRKQHETPRIKEKETDLMRPSFPGQSAVEYLLPIALIAILALGSLMVLGNTLSNQFSGMISTVNYSALTPNGQYQPNITQLMDQIETTSVQYTLQNGQTVTLNGYPADLTRAVETLGTSGASDVMAAVMQSLAFQLRQNQEISEQETNRILGLANQGHSLAATQGVLANALRSANGDLNTLKTMQVSHNGESINVLELLNRVGSTETYVPGNNIPQEQINPIAVEAFNLDSLGKPFVGTELADFLNLYSNVQDEQVLKDPGLERILQTLSTQVMQLSLLSARNAYVVWDESVPFDPNVPLDAGAYSHLTNIESSGICHLGGGQDKGVSCSG